jgi:hypothetical protein
LLHDNALRDSLKLKAHDQCLCSKEHVLVARRGVGKCSASAAGADKLATAGAACGSERMIPHTSLQLKEHTFYLSGDPCTMSLSSHLGSSSAKRQEDCLRQEGGIGLMPA